MRSVCFLLLKQPSNNLGGAHTILAYLKNHKSTTSSLIRVGLAMLSSRFIANVFPLEEKERTKRRKENISERIKGTYSTVWLTFSHECLSIHFQTILVRENVNQTQALTLPTHNFAPNTFSNFLTDVIFAVGKLRKGERTLMSRC